MPLAQVTAGNRITTTDVNQIYNLLKGVTGSGESITLIYNNTGVIVLQPSSDPSASTQMVQVKNNAGTVQFAVRADGSLVFADATVQTTAAAGAITTATNNLSADVTMTNANQFYDGPSVSLVAGTWLVIGTVTLINSATGFVTAKLWNGTTASASAGGYHSTAASDIALSVSGIVTPGSTTTYKISVASNTTTATIRAVTSTNSPGNFASHIRAIKVA